MPRTFLLGNTVFYDRNGNGMQDNPALEPGINKVRLHLLDDNGPAGTVQTQRGKNPSTGMRENGIYTFAVDPEFGPPIAANPGGDLIARTYTVVVAPENFAREGFWKASSVPRLELIPTPTRYQTRPSPLRATTCGTTSATGP